MMQSTNTAHIIFIDVSSHMILRIQITLMFI